MQAQQYLSRFRQMAGNLQPSAVEDCSLFTREAGSLLLLYSAGRHFGDNAMLHEAERLLDEHIDLLCDYPVNFKFAYGGPGFGWLLQYLCNRGALQEDFSPLLEDIDLGTEKALRWDYDDKIYDLMIGYTGKGIYLLERFDATQSPAVRATLESIITNIRLHAIPQPGGGVAWLDYYTNTRNKEFTDPYYNFGMAHGIPSIVMFLLHCAARGIQAETCVSLATGACRWMLAQQQPEGVFPVVIAQNGERYSMHTHSFSWCYGVLPVALCIAATGIFTGDADIAAQARSIMLKTAALDEGTAGLRPVPHEGPNIFICHGTAGISHMFRKFNSLFGDAPLSQAADYWMDVTFREIDRYPMEAFKQEQSLLNGSTGIAMVLLNALAPGHLLNDWDKVLFLDVEKFIPGVQPPSREAAHQTIAQ